MVELTLVQKVIVWAIPVIFAITVHETAHGWMAMRLGDRTALMLGRLTLNPFKHIDPVGTVIVPGVMLLVSNFIFGWAKPVPVTWENLKRPKQDMVLVALAGPAANLLMALMWGGILKLCFLFESSSSGLLKPVAYMGEAGVYINVLLMVLNLIPIPPLDGGRIVAGLLPNRLSWQYSRIEPFGFLILVTLLVTGILGNVMWPVLENVKQLIFSLFNLM